MQLVLAVLVFSMVNVHAKRGTFPKELQRCHKNDPKLNDCLKNAIQKALPFLAKGLPKAGLLPLDPLYTSKINMEQDYGAVTLNVSFSDLYTRGYANQTVIRKVRAKVAEHNIRIFAFFPQVELSGNYDIKANIFVLPIEGKGKFSITMENVEADLEIRGESQLRGGDEYMKLKKLPLDFQPSKIIFNLQNLFNGDERLGSAANVFMNLHAMATFRATKSLLTDTTSSFIKRFAQPFFDQVPYTEIYL